MRAHSHGCWREFLTMRTSPRGCLSVFPTWLPRGLPQSECSKREQSRDCADFDDFAFEAMLHPFYNISLAT